MIDTHPFFTLIIPMYNASKQIASLIATLKKWNDCSFEAILSDDGSHDDTMAVCESAVNGDQRFSILRGEHKCSAAAPRNHALRHAVGQYVLFLDSDDEPVMETLRPMAAFLKKKNFPDILCCQCSTGKLKADGDYIEYGLIRIMRQSDGELSGRQLLEQLGNSGSSLPCNVFLSAYKREFLVENKLFQQEDLLLGEDYVWAPLVFLAAKRVCAFDAVHYRYIRRDDSVTGTLQERCFADAGKASARLGDFYWTHKNEMSRPIQSFWSRYALNLYLWYFFNPVYQNKLSGAQWRKAWREAGMFDSVAHWRRYGILFQQNSMLKKCFIPSLLLGSFGIRFPGVLFFQLSEKIRACVALLRSSRGNQKPPTFH